MKATTFIDLFCGVGGFRYALESIGAECVFSSDIDPLAREYYAANHGEVPSGDITKIDPSDIPDHTILCGGFPCQAFSAAGHQRGFDDTRGTLIFNVLEIMRVKRPAVAILENVKGLVSHDGGRTFDVIKRAIAEIGYTLHWKVLSASEFGLAQARERVFLVCMRDGQKYRFPAGSGEVVTMDDIKDDAWDGSDIVKKEIEWTKMEDGRKVKHLKRLGLIGGVNQQQNRVYSGLGVGQTLMAGGFGSASGCGNYTLEGVVRMPTKVECCRMQGLPDDLVLPDRRREFAKLLGNSVPVPVVRAVALEAVEVLTGKEYMPESLLDFM